MSEIFLTSHEYKVVAGIQWSIWIRQFVRALETTAPDGDSGPAKGSA